MGLVSESDSLSLNYACGFNEGVPELIAIGASSFKVLIKNKSVNNLR